MVYNLTNLTSASGNATSFLSFTQQVSVNILGGSWIGWIILMIVFGVFFFSIKGKGYYTSTAFAVACWMVALCAILLRVMNLVDDWTWAICLLSVPISIVILFMAAGGMSS